MRAGIALGSNIESRLLFLQAARRRLLALHADSSPVLCSRVYETSPVACPPNSPPFLNAVIELSTALPPPALLAELHRIEEDLGRSAQHEKNSPRTIDLDLLYLDSLALCDQELTIPHPRLASRRFVLQPLADIRPHLVLPGFTKSIRELLRELRGDEDVCEYAMSIY